MPTQEISQRVNRRLEELYHRHQSLHEDEVIAYYAPGTGYHRPEEFVKSEHKRFAICLATTDGEIFCAGDHDRPFALQSISKVFIYGMALEAYGRDNVLKCVGVEPSASVAKHEGGPTHTIFSDVDEGYPGDVLPPAADPGTTVPEGTESSLLTLAQ